MLAGKVCVVSGVGPGLGRQAARALAAHGADVVLAARREANLEEVLAEVTGLGARGLAVPTNIVDPDACAALMAAAAREFGGIDVVVMEAQRRAAEEAALRPSAPRSQGPGMIDDRVAAREGRWRSVSTAAAKCPMASAV